MSCRSQEIARVPVQWQIFSTLCSIVVMSRLCLRTNCLFLSSLMCVHHVQAILRITASDTRMSMPRNQKIDLRRLEWHLPKMLVTFDTIPNCCGSSRNRLWVSNEDPQTLEASDSDTAAVWTIETALDSFHRCVLFSRSTTFQIVFSWPSCDCRGQEIAWIPVKL